MMRAVQILDKALGPLSPSRQAHASAPNAKRVLVFGANEPQGLAVADTLSKKGKYVVTAVFEDMDHPHTDMLTKQQVKVVQGTLADKRSYERYLADQEAIYLDSNYWHYLDAAEGDLSLARQTYFDENKICIDAMVQAGVKHLVYSALDDFPEDKYVPQYSAKAKVVKYLQTTALPTTLLYTSHAYSDFLHLDHLERNPTTSGETEERYVLSIPVPDDTVLPGYAVEQTGEWVFAILQGKGKWIGKSVHACASAPTLAQMAADLSRTTGKAVDTLHMTRTEFYSEKMQERVGEFMWPQYRNYVEGLFETNLEHSTDLVPHVWTFRQWATQSKDLKAVMAELANSETTSTSSVVPKATSSTVSGSTAAGTGTDTDTGTGADTAASEAGAGKKNLSPIAASPISPVR